MPINNSDKESDWECLHCHDKAGSFEAAERCEYLCRNKDQIGKRHPEWKEFCHPAHTVDLNSGNTGGTFDPQETMFTMRDGARLTFYPDAVPERLGDSWRFWIDNNCETHYLLADAVVKMETMRQADVKVA